jgi:polysaccharide export outer membrane protein
MRHARYLFALVAALAVSACARQQQAYYVVDPQTGQPVPVVAQSQFTQPQYSQPQYAQQGQPASQPSATSARDRGLFSSSPSYAQPTYAQQPTYQQPAAPSGARDLYSSSPAYAQQAYQQPPAQVAPRPQAAPSRSRGLFTQGGSFASQPNYAQQPNYAAPQGGPYVAAPNAYAAAPAAYNVPYTLDSGDRLRIVVFGQDGITNSYTVDAGGNVNLPLVGSVPARGSAPAQLASRIGERLKQGYVREPHVTVEVETYRPFFILGEVTNPGQYPYVANMTAETAVAIAGGFAPRAYKSKIELTRNAPGQQIHGDVPLNYPLRPGDTIVVKERWF